MANITLNNKNDSNYFVIFLKQTSRKWISEQHLYQEGKSRSLSSTL
jgi:hypothetical protein